MSRPRGYRIPIDEVWDDDEDWDREEEEMMRVVQDIKAKGPSAYKDTCACDYMDMQLTKAASKNFVNNPSNRAVIDFLKKYTLDTSEVNKQLAYYMWESGGDMKKVAKNFLRTSDIWLDWLPYEVAKNVSSSVGKIMLAKKEPKKKEKKVAKKEKELKAGEIISTGTCTGLLDVLPGNSVVAEFGLLGSVEIRFT